MDKAIQKAYELFTKNGKITTDSRDVVEGSIFIALRGDNFDGNSYATQALKSGAALCVIDNPLYVSDSCLLVPDTLEFLQQFANYHRKCFKIPIIAITGTNGKTTTKELITTVLNTCYKVTSTQGNLNNHIGVPLTLLRITSDTEIAIIEMGANHQGEIAKLCQICEPNHGIITNVGKAHLEGFGSYEGIIKTKNELYQWLSNNQGMAFVNSENELLMQLSSNLKRTIYGNNKDIKEKVKIIQHSETLSFEYPFNNNTYPIHTHLIGNYNLENILAAICIGNYFKIPIQKSISAIEQYKPSNNRSQLIDTLNNKVIMDAYNANPTSMQAAMQNFIKIPGNNKIMILGDMLELGNESIEEHSLIIEWLINNNMENTILVGHEFSKLSHNKIRCFINSEEAKEYLKKEPLKGYTILLKGSRGIRMEKILEVL